MGTNRADEEEGKRILRECPYTACWGKSIRSENTKQYRRGYEDGLRAYAWWKDGVQYVGTCGKTLAEALEEGG